ncbi:conserved phage C-terminal domain-containing protein [Olsenella phocaeensis]|uniref:conserved phage C-terminal domain-containing protein n=1 Tax=Olsenella phocaeensis TaxID=1852385 RepID=UPI003A946605
MKVCIQQDMWDVAARLPRGQRDLLVGALVAYGFTGEEPEPSAEPWSLLFDAFKGRIEMSARRSRKGGDMAEARWAATGGAGGTDEPEESQVATHAQIRDAAEQDKHRQIRDAATPDEHEQKCRTENENETENEKRAPLTPQRGEREVPPGVAEATGRFVARLNAATGASYRADSRATRRLVAARLREGYDASQLERVVDNMAAQWSGDARMRQFLRPSTLLRPGNFEGYLNAAPPGGARAAPDFSEFEGLGEPWVPLGEEACDERPA